MLLMSFEHGHRLADPGAAEQADLAALGERADQVDHLDAGLEQLNRRRELVELGSGSGGSRAARRIDRPFLVDRAPEHVHDAPERALAHRHRDRLAGRLHLHAAAHAVGGAERDAAHDAVAELLLDLEGEPFLHQAALTALFQHERVVDVRHRFARKLDVDHRADGLNDGSLCLCHGFPLNGGSAADDFRAPW